MKKTTKLKLKRVTVANLTPEETGRIRGGALFTVKEFTDDCYETLGQECHSDHCVPGTLSTCTE